MKKRLFNLLFGSLVMFFLVDSVYADELVTEYIKCGGMSFPKPIAPIIHTTYILLQIVIPLGIIIVGSLDFVKATIASDVDKMKKSQKKFVSRLIAGSITFFVFVIVKFAIDVFSDEPDNDEIKPDFGNCLNCLINNEGCVEIADSPFEPD